jgi:elongator complex protein 3
MEKYANVDNLDKSTLYDDEHHSKDICGKMLLCSSSTNVLDASGDRRVVDIESIGGNGVQRIYVEQNSVIPEKLIDAYRGFATDLANANIYDIVKSNINKKNDYHNLFGFSDMKLAIISTFFKLTFQTIVIYYTIFMFMIHPFVFSIYFTIHIVTATIFVTNVMEMVENREYIDVYVPCEKKFKSINLELRRKYKIVPKKSELLYMYRKLVASHTISKNEILEDFLVTRKMRSTSGVIVVSVIMPPDTFSCSYNCSYCPNDPRYSRSYYHGEPTVMRGKRNGFKAFEQFRERVHSYIMNGHDVDKIECIILGGTFSCYQPKVAEEFITGLFYAANTAFDDPSSLRPMLNIADEQRINESTHCRIIGVTIETRPDKITKPELRRFRKYGVTRIQMGVQHTDDEVLEKNNRECTTAQVKAALKLCKDECFKVDIHLMPDLPYSTPEKDELMFKTVLSDPALQADQWKIYPTCVLEFTEIKKWFDEGTYVPYAETNYEEFLRILTNVMKNIPPWIRVNRVQRDFPSIYIEGGNKVANLRQVLDDKLAEASSSTQEIRTMEVRHNMDHIHRARLVRCDYDGQDGKEIFLSFKSCTCGTYCKLYEEYKVKKTIYEYLGFPTPYFYGCGKEDVIYGFLRLRISENAGKITFSDLQQKGLIRELHVYGNVVPVYSKNSDQQLKSQHFGFGKQLVANAERIVKQEAPQLNGMAVISGVGVRNYYRKLGYEIPHSDFNAHGNILIKHF